jgi:hypothetical protein
MNRNNNIQTERVLISAIIYPELHVDKEKKTGANAYAIQTPK